MITLAEPPIVDVAYPVRAFDGKNNGAIPADHGFALFSAVSDVLPFVHGNVSVGIHPIQGILAGARRLQLGPASRVVLRLPASHAGETLPLAGKGLSLGDTKMIVGAPKVLALKPSAILRSRIVVIRDMLDADSLLAAARRQLDVASVGGMAGIPTRRTLPPLEASGQGSRDQYLRRTLMIRDKAIVGYAIEVKGLTAEESISLQENGIGGRRRFGCGIFLPAEEG